MDCTSVKEKLCTWNVLVTLCLGQLLSLLICGTGVTSGILGEKGVNIPTAQSFLNYALLCFVYTTLLACNKDSSICQVFKQRGWKYFLLALVDVEANYLIVKAYHYTTVTSVQLLDCFVIPTVLLLSWIFLRVRYKALHFIGVLVCLLGVGALVFADYLVAKNTTDAKNKLLGDFLCLGAAVLYGVSNVGQEYVVKNFNRIEYLGMIGFFGSFINGLQFVILERREVAGVKFSDYQTVLALVGFVICLFVLYSLMPVVIEKTSATAVNLNLLSADFYALLVGLFLFHYKFHFLYFISFVMILLGLVLYSIKSPPTDTPVTRSNSSNQSNNSASCDDLHEIDSEDKSLSTKSGSTTVVMATAAESNVDAVRIDTGCHSDDDMETRSSNKSDCSQTLLNKPDEPPV